ncbi:MAG: hypothetical protein ACXADH_05020 [Candidatus Kariarchaeaceae archaeon]
MKNIFIGYIKNYHTLNLTFTHGNDSFTLKEIDYFARLGSVLGFDIFTEDTIDGTQRAMDLTWWGDFDAERDEWQTLILHLERENYYKKAEDTLDKLYNYKKYRPLYRIGIIHVRNEDRIIKLQKIASKLFKSEEVLLVYRIDKEIDKSYEIHGYLIKEMEKPIVAISKELPSSHIIYMNLKP